MQNAKDRCDKCGQPVGNNGIRLKCGKQQRDFCRSCMYGNSRSLFNQAMIAMGEINQEEKRLGQQHQNA